MSPLANPRRHVLAGTFVDRAPVEAQRCTVDDPRRDFAMRDAIVVATTGRPRFDGAYEAIQRKAGSAAALLAAYRDRGVGCLERVAGQFAVAIHDGARGESLLAVDRLGIEPLCFALDGGRVRFAAQAHALADGPDGARPFSTGADGSLDPQAVFDYLYFHYIPGSRTIYRGVSRVLPGHVVRIVGGIATVSPFWKPTYVERGAVDVPRDEQEFLRIVERAVARAAEGATKPGAFLSGGTDSSTVIGMLGAATGTAAHGYSIGFEAEGFDEMSYARIAAKRFGVDHHEYYVTPADLVTSIPMVAAACDQPFGNSSILPTYYCARMAAADGVDRLLGGDGGDELFGGNTRYAKQRVFDYFDRAPKLVRRAARVALGPAAWQSVPLVKKVQSYVRQADVPMPDRLQTYNLLSRIGIDRILEPGFLAHVDVDSPMLAMRDWYGRSSAATLVNRMLEFDLKYTLTDNDLPKVTTACRLAGVDVAYPLLDDELVAFAERLHPDLKLKGLKLRWFFKHALRDFLPHEILTKSKHGFGLPFGIWLGRDARLNELAFSSLDALKTRGIVRPSFVDQLRRDLLADHATYYGELVWALMMLEQWLQAHRPPSPGR